MPMRVPTRPTTLSSSDDSADLSGMSDISQSALASAAALSSESETNHNTWASDGAPATPHETLTDDDDGMPALAEGGDGVADDDDDVPGTPPCVNVFADSTEPPEASPSRASPGAADGTAAPSADALLTAMADAAPATPRRRPVHDDDDDEASPDRADRTPQPPADDLLAAMVDAAPPTPRVRAFDEHDDEDDFMDDDEGLSGMRPDTPHEPTSSIADDSADPDWQPSQAPSQEASQEASMETSIETSQEQWAHTPAPEPVPAKSARFKPRFTAPSAPAASAPAPKSKPTKRKTIAMSSSSEGEEATPAAQDDDGDAAAEAPILTPVTTAKPKDSKKRKNSAKASKGGADSGGGGAGGSKGDATTSTPAKRDKKDPNAPKAALSSYQLWNAEARKVEPFASMSFVDASKALGAAWKEVTVEERAPFEAKAKADKQRYAEEMRKYKPSAPTTPKATTPKATTPKATTPKATTPKAASSGRKQRAQQKKRPTAVASVLREDDSSDEEAPGEMAIVPHSFAHYAGPQPIVDARLVPAPESKPKLTDLRFEPRELQPMRRERFRDGEEVAWMPQCFAQFLEAHELLMQDHVFELLGDKLPGAASRLMRRPADGTANSAKVVSIESTAVPGLTLLHLVATDALKKAGGSSRGGAAVVESGVESGFESLIESDGDGDEHAGGETYSKYSLPVLSRQHCDVDVHLVLLKTYLNGVKRTRQVTQVSVPFAADEGAATQSSPKEVLWEGRAFDTGKVADPERYPKSLYKSMHVVWYRCLERSKSNKNLDHWVFDEEQTDNLVSPWDTQPSNQHIKWRSAFPQLAGLYKPRARRGSYKPTALVEAPESMDIEQMEVDGAEPASVEQDAIERVLKRLLSNEAAEIFFHPVPKDEVEYHKAVTAPICLNEIVVKAEVVWDEDGGAGGGYDSYAAFLLDVERLLNNAFYFNEADTQFWIAACMLQKDLSDAHDELRAKGLDHLLDGMHIPSHAEPLLALTGPRIGAEAMDED